MNDLIPVTQKYHIENWGQYHTMMANSPNGSISIAITLWWLIGTSIGIDQLQQQLYPMDHIFKTN